ncbi:MAG: VWA domain-containing protein [Desulfurococcales archaeon]|nr:VWA domain-containing protein [Desulfurococcales archaeon]
MTVAGTDEKEEGTSLFEGLDINDPLKKYRGSRIIRITRKMGETNLGPSGLKVPLELAEEVYYAFFITYPVFKDNLSFDDKDLYYRYVILNSLLGNESFQKAKAYTIADPTTSTVAASVFLHNLTLELRKQAGFPGKGDYARKGRQSSAPGYTNEGEPKSIDDEKLKKAVESALNKTVESVKAAKELTTFVESFTSGASSMMTLEDAVPELVKMAEKSDVNQLLDNLSGLDIGKIKFSRIIDRSIKGEITGLESGTDLERLHPSQLALPEVMFLASFANQNLLLYEKGLPARQGPVYVLLDKSGSMTGKKIVWAKTVTLALFKRAISESRWFMIRFFDSVPYPLYKISPRAKGREVVKLIDYMVRVKPQGGTDISRAIRTAIQDITETKQKRLKPGDIVLVTDGEDRINPADTKKTLAMAKLNLIVVMVGGDNESLRQASDYYMKAYKLSDKEALEVVYYKREH